ncbi:oxidoreductase [Acidaminobacter sp. JC074]|uniref:Gfo/Idh/MocA family oxidoreductase n=1 Tax=Acidaminobacter sp. JC074 TaxID=2530199 RepID=UPI001F0FAC20|nr:Gfo/Idh/MocA family oxidoreductase [Acidaminobacter sp. JC074]MCH4888216.1 oxidoreductase [Acidaminobacter sp. JC074]
MKINVGIIGYGLSGHIFHGMILKEMDKFCIKKIYTRSKKNTETAIKSHPDVEIVSDVNLIFEDPSIDVVVVCTPNTSHFDLASKALLNKKHVVIEKPFTVTTHDALRLMDLEHDSKKSIAVYHNRRFDGDYLTLKSLINEDKVGRIVEFESHFDRFRNTFKKQAWREQDLPGSGILYDLGSHLIDQALDLFGLPQEVYADISNQRRGQTDDAFEVILYYSELKVTLKAGMLVNADIPRFMVHGTEGSYTKYGLDSQEGQLRDGMATSHPDYGKNTTGLLKTTTETEVQNENGDYRAFYDNLYDHIINNQPLVISSKDGFNVMRIIEAAYHSQQLHKRIFLKH